MRNLFLLTLLLTIGFASQADVQKKLHLEATIESRIKQMVSTMDPYVHVVAEVKVKKRKVRLPATNLDVVDILGGGVTETVKFEDLSEIDIRIYTTLDPFPQWLEDNVKTAFNYDNVAVNFDIQLLDESTLNQIKDNSPLQQVSDRFLDKLQKYYYLFFGMGLALLVILIGYAMSSVNIRKKATDTLGSHMNRLIKELSEGGIGGAGQRSVMELNEPPPGLQQAKPPQISGGGGIGEIPHVLLEMPVEGVVALFSDCYWCEQDGYAYWIWRRITGEQRMKLIQSWVYAESYSRSLNPAEEVDLEMHNHPTYLNPLPIARLSQGDLVEWIKKNPAAWWRLSPMRQKSIPMSIEERLKFFDDPTQFMGPIQPPDHKSSPRALQNIISFGDLTPDDEEFLMNNRDALPAEWREGVPTLVWFSFLPKEVREEALARISAEDIARAWVGPESVLNSLKEVIPEKKWNLVQEYINRGVGSRDSVQFKFLSKFALEKLDELDEEQTDFHEPEVEIADDGEDVA